MTEPEFIELVRKLRDHQRRWFRWRKTEDLEQSKKLEKQVDRWLEREAGPKVARSMFDSHME